MVWSMTEVKSEVNVHPLERNDNTAVMKGYTRHVEIETGMYILTCLIHPETDLDDRFLAFDTDEQEWIYINGWLVTGVEELED